MRNPSNWRRANLDELNKMHANNPARGWLKNLEHRLDAWATYDASYELSSIFLGRWSALTRAKIRAARAAIAAAERAMRKEAEARGLF